MGAVFSQAPRRWRGVVAEVPFVDVVNTMLDETIPLTAQEWDEWGDPRRAEDFAWMRAYSPYDNVPAPADRPRLLVTGAVHDPRVMYWEPAKWTARMRASGSLDDRLLLRMELGAGAHVGPSGRYGHLRVRGRGLRLGAGHGRAVGQPVDQLQPAPHRVDAHTPSRRRDRRRVRPRARRCR